MKPEMAVRRIIYGMGYRYRLHGNKLPGKPDLIFSSKRKVIFVHGCFWHQHPDPKCPDGSRRKPKSNTAFWNLKLKNNVERDKKNQNLLGNMGWRILIIWECETKNKELLEMRISEFLD